MQEEARNAEGQRLTKIVTHDDFDGVVSAALCSIAEGIDFYRFTAPGSILDMHLGVGPDTIVCDLPHHPAAGLWFDHHTGNLEDYRLKGGDPAAIRGAFSPERSCARVIYNYYEKTVSFPDFMASTVRETDIIDSFDYKDIADWQRETPVKILAEAMRVSFPTLKDRDRFFRHLIRLVREMPLEQVLADPQVKERAAEYRQFAERNIPQIERLAAFFPEDTDREIVLLDTTGLKHALILNKSLAFLPFPEAKAVLEVKSLFQQKRKTNNLSFSMSLSPCVDMQSSTKDIGEIMRTLNIGDGHRGAGSGRIECGSKPEMLRQKDHILKKIVSIWRGQ